MERLRTRPAGATKCPLCREPLLEGGGLTLILLPTPFRSALSHPSAVDPQQDADRQAREGPEE